MTNKDNLIRPALFRHLVIIIYDLLLLFSILLLATFIIVALNNGTAIGPGNPFFIAYLFPNAGVAIAIYIFILFVSLNLFALIKRLSAFNLLD